MLHKTTNQGKMSENYLMTKFWKLLCFNLCQRCMFRKVLDPNLFMYNLKPYTLKPFLVFIKSNV